MSVTSSVPVKDLALDLANFSHIRQASELTALHAMISTSPDRFLGTHGQLDPGRLPANRDIHRPTTGPGRSMLI